MYHHHQDFNNMLQGGSIPDESGLFLSTDAKPRLKWTPELHDRFIEAVNQLGGADKATPKTIMRLMGIPGLTLYHLKSHLQKCRLSKAQAHTGGGSKSGKSSIPICNQTVSIRHNVAAERPSETDIIRQPNRHIQINEALLMQIEVQRQLQEQLERHLQLRIEAQGKYLQSVLEKAQEALGKQNQLSELVSSAVSNGCLSNAVPVPEDLLPNSNSSLLTPSEGLQKERESNRKPFSSSISGGGGAAAEADTEKLDLNVDEDDDEGAIESKIDLN
ncbi:myb-related protein 2-like isoform X2 [Zingiber officinale]|uniref:myb-related protein 2-like isoform X2 n=1 Tax=Zingiber officinale TaxID=94328 RepID=UPI001C4D2C1A|nr:myb-related protein 2-like isoform X2 [Zingiber officinale]